ncbi:hypothetical protein [Actinoplanes philippinensis]|uniref:hypothetical protein n=1 Tax=Actinoplanes philippinensis TaxID=35752 RepID=UPI0033E7B41D
MAAHGWSAYPAALAGALVAAMGVSPVTPSRAEPAPRSPCNPAPSDIRGAIATVEQYYSDHGRYPGAPMSGDNSRGDTPVVALGAGTFVLSRGTRLYYVPHPPGYRIFATNAGYWYAYDSARGGSVRAVSRPAGAEVC